MGAHRLQEVLRPKQFAAGFNSPLNGNIAGMAQELKGREFFTSCVEQRPGPHSPADA